MVVELIETLESWDRQLFLLMNGDPAWSLLDEAMFWFSETNFWLPVYLFLLHMVWQRYRVKGAALTLVFTALLIALCDQVSVHLFKETIERYRPCYNAIVGPETYMVGGCNGEFVASGNLYGKTCNGHICGGQYGFVSSHAANHFGLSFFLAWVLGRKRRVLFTLLILWAALIGYSRIYLGVHYPGDVLGGAVLGWGIAYLVYRLFDQSRSFFGIEAQQ